MWEFSILRDNMILYSKKESVTGKMCKWAQYWCYTIWFVLFTNHVTNVKLDIKTSYVDHHPGDRMSIEIYDFSFKRCLISHGKTNLKPRCIVCAQYFISFVIAPRLEIWKKQTNKCEVEKEHQLILIIEVKLISVAELNAKQRRVYFTDPTRNETDNTAVFHQAPLENQAATSASCTCT